MLEVVRRSIYTDFILPLLRASDVDAFLLALPELFEGFVERLSTLRDLLKITKDGDQLASIRRREESYRPKLEQFILESEGQEAADEYDFACETADRATALGRRVTSLGPPRDQEMDRTLCAEFHQAMGLHLLANTALCALEQQLVAPPAADVPPALVYFLRLGAVEAFAKVRAAHALREIEERVDAVDSANTHADPEAKSLAEEHIADADRLIRAQEPG